MKRRLSVLMVSALTLAVVIAGPASALDRVVTLEANLTGEQETQPADRDGNGDAKLIVTRHKVCYLLSAEDIGKPIAAHIHRGVRGVAGPIVVPLNTPTGNPITGFFSRGCEKISRDLSRDLREHPSRFYVNVHTKRFPDGAIRGQLHR